MILLDKVNVKFHARKEAPVHAVRDVSLRVNAGDFFGIEGTIGSGKITLLSTIK